MDHRQPSDLPPNNSYPSPNTAQMVQGAMPYYTNQRQQAAEDLNLQNQLMREAASDVDMGMSNGMNNGQAAAFSTPNQSTQAMGPPSSNQAVQQVAPYAQSQQTGMEPNDDLSYGDGSARRKRSKVSRACDECRRKKIRCDASGDTDVVTCSNCTRNNLTCTFSRIPLKRGPSKGYIKELSDRVVSLEAQVLPGAQVHTGAGIAPSGPGYAGYDDDNFDGDGDIADWGGTPLSRKRTHSMAESLAGAHPHAPDVSRGRFPSSGGWAPLPSNRLNEPSALSNRQSVGLATEPSPNQPDANGVRLVSPLWSSQAAATQDTTNSAQDQTVTSSHQLQEAQEDLTSLEEDMTPVDAYYRHVQEVLPILPNSYDREFHLLHDCSRDTQKAWHVALYGAVGMSMPSQYSALFLNGGHVKTQDRLIGLAREPASSRSLKNNIVLFQICLLMAVEADARGPKNLRYRNGPIPKGVWLDSALFLGTQIIKTTGRFNAHQKSDAYEDSDGNIARRLWIVLIIMIRMHSVSVGAFDQTHGCEIGSPEDKKILPKSTYDLAVLSGCLRAMHEVFIKNQGLNIRRFEFLAIGMKEQVQTLVNLMKSTQTTTSEPNDKSTVSKSLTNTVPLMQLYLKLIVNRNVYIPFAYEVLEPALDMVELLKTQQPPGPLDVHFFALATVTLHELTQIPEYSPEAWVGLNTLLNSLRDRRDLYHQKEEAAKTLQKEYKPAPDCANLTYAWDCAMANLITKRDEEVKKQKKVSTEENGAAAMATASLEHLAEAAVGTTEAPDPMQDSRPHFDFALLTQTGYLNALAKYQ